MVNYCKKEVAAYIEQLVSEEKSRSTREQYERNIRRFLNFAEGKELTKELSRGEYLRLVQTADRQGDDRIAAILQTICSTGIRVSELKCITAEAILKRKYEYFVKIFLYKN